MTIGSGGGGGGQDATRRLTADFLSGLYEIMTAAVADLQTFRRDHQAYIDVMQGFCNDVADRLDLIYAISPSLNPSRRPWIDRAALKLESIFSNHAQMSTRPRIGMMGMLGKDQVLSIMFVPNTERNPHQVMQHVFSVSLKPGTTEAQTQTLTMNIARQTGPFRERTSSVATPGDLRRELDGWFQRVGGDYAHICPAKPAPQAHGRGNDLR